MSGELSTQGEDVHFKTLRAQRVWNSHELILDFLWPFTEENRYLRNGGNKLSLS